MPARKRTAKAVRTTAVHDWRTTDADEIERRRARAREETFQITNGDRRHPLFSNFQVRSGSGLTYTVEVRDLQQRAGHCSCVDFRINGLGTCKHVEAVLLHLEARFRRLFAAARRTGSDRIEIVHDNATDSLRVERGLPDLPAPIRRLFTAQGQLRSGSPENAVAALRRLAAADVPRIRISQEVERWLENRRRVEDSRQLRHEYELKVQGGEWPAQETTVPLFPYQREGMLHLAFTERALLADEMGLGKTIQAIAACALLHRLGRARRVLVVTPASLKTEWEDQIQRFTPLTYQLVFGGRQARLEAYDRAGITATPPKAPASKTVPANPPPAAVPPFFTLVNYEQMLADALEVNQRLAPDVVILDEAQRIKNWDTKTAQAIKRLRSRYAFVLTGTPIENRIDELHSLMDFLNPSVLGPLFRFNREFYELDDRGRPSACRNLDVLHERVRPYMLRRRKAEVETELPERTDRQYFVPLSASQRQDYESHEYQVARLLNTAMRRPLTQQEQDKLQRELAMMRMICDTSYILNPNDRTCPKLAELEKILEECIANDAKVIVFSEWERMLELVRDLCARRGIGCAWHTGSVPQLRRRAEINLFKSDPACRVFLSTDAGATGLNLQNASVVINCDLPWNPARLEQRIARAWRKHQTRPVTVAHLIAENTIEHRMLETLALKQTMAQSVLDQPGTVTTLQLRGGRQAFVERLQQLVSSRSPSTPATPTPPPLPVDRGLAFARLAASQIDGALIRCEERYPREGAHSVLLVVVDRDPEAWRPRLAAIHQQLFGPGKSDPLAPVHLEVIDRATDEALQRLAAAGLLSPTARATRPLDASRDPVAAAPLTPDEQARAKTHRDHATRRLTMARLLAEGGFADEARPALLEAVVSLASALAVEARLPLPSVAGDTLVAPLSMLWKESLEAVTRYVKGEATGWQPLIQQLAGL